MQKSTKKLLVVLAAVIIFGVAFLALNPSTSSLFQGQLKLMQRPVNKVQPNLIKLTDEKSKTQMPDISKLNLAENLNRLKRGRSLPAIEVGKLTVKLTQDPDENIAGLRSLIRSMEKREALKMTDDFNDRLFDREFAKYIATYSVFEECTGENENWCHSETGEQLIYENLGTQYAGVNAGDFRICLEGRPTDTTVVERVSFVWYTNREMFGTVTIGGQQVEGVRLSRYDTTTFNLTTPITLEASNCIDVGVVLEDLPQNQERNLEYFSMGLNDVGTDENLPIRQDVYYGRGRTNIFVNNNELEFYRYNYDGMDRGINRRAGENFGGYRVCAVDSNYGEVGNFSIQITRNDGAPQQVYVSQDIYNDYMPGLRSVDYLEQEITLQGIENVITVEPVRRELTYGDCLTIWFTTAEPPVPAIDRMKLTLTDVDFPSDTEAYYKVYENGRWERYSLDSPWEHDWFVIIEGNFNPYVRVNWNMPNSYREEDFTRNGTGQECFDDTAVIEVTEDMICPILRLILSLENNEDSDMSIAPGRVRFNVVSESLEPFDLHLYAIVWETELAEQIFTIEPGNNVVEWDLAEVVEPGWDFYQIVGYAVPDEYLQETGDGIFDFGLVRFTLDLWENRQFNLSDDRIGELYDIFVSGNVIPGDPSSGSGLQPLPYTTGNLIVDEPKVLVESYTTGARNISLADIAADTGILQLFGGSMTSLAGGVRLDSMTFMHNVNKERVPGDTLELSIGSSSYVPTEWVQNQSVRFDFPEGNKPTIWDSQNIQLNLINPNTEIIHERELPTIFRLAEVELISIEDMFREIPFLVTIMTGFDINLDTGELIPIPFTGLSGTIWFIEE